jgi:hypothetical protein
MTAKVAAHCGFRRESYADTTRFLQPAPSHARGATHATSRTFQLLMSVPSPLDTSPGNLQTIVRRNCDLHETVDRRRDELLAGVRPADFKTNILAVQAEAKM